MVMDGTPSPSPQCVGQEFVRQYYTLLNEAPEYVHRFYSHDSSFIHGGSSNDVPVVGQSEIHKKIMSLRFNDCHAKIRYVDSQSTVSTGVVVQVTGELSNNQQPMRRFMQTFVLAPQDRNKYYVHNDIFRYQDEVFSEEEEDENQVEPNTAVDSHSMEQQREESPDKSVMEVAQQVNNVNLYQQQHQVDAPVEHHQFNGRHDSSPPAVDTEVTATELALSNGHGEEPRDTAISASPRPASPVNPTQQASSYSSPEPETGNTSAADGDQGIQLHKADAEAAMAGDKPKSWANILNPSTGQVSSDASPPSSNSPDKPVIQSNPRSQAIRNTRLGNNAVADCKGLDMMYFDDSYRKYDRTKYPDSQQVFVGNLPSSIVESELTEFFNEHGKVLQVRVNRNSTTKLPFGFVVFDHESSAQKVLAYKSMDYYGQRLNIEEKKPRNDNRTHSNSRNGGGRRDGGRHTRGGGMNRRGGLSHDDWERNEHGRYNNLNKSNPHRY